MTNSLTGDDFSADTSTTGRVSVGGSTTGSLQFSGDSDWFSVSLQANNTYRFGLDGSATSAGTLADPVLGLRNSSGVVLASDDDSGSGLNAQITYTPTTTGTSYLAAQALSGTGSYTVRGDKHHR